MGQQHRTRAKRKRRRAYLKRKKEVAKAATRTIQKTRIKKQAAAIE